MSEENHREEDKAPGPLALLGTVMAAALGVQSQKNRERDFKHGKASTFIVAGIVFTALFIGVLYTVVTLVLRSAGH